MKRAKKGMVNWKEQYQRAETVCSRLREEVAVYRGASEAKDMAIERVKAEIALRDETIEKLQQEIRLAGERQEALRKSFAARQKAMHSSEQRVLQLLAETQAELKARGRQVVALMRALILATESGRWYSNLTDEEKKALPVEWPPIQWQAAHKEGGAGTMVTRWTKIAPPGERSVPSDFGGSMEDFRPESDVYRARADTDSDTKAARMKMSVAYARNVETAEAGE